MTTKKIKIALVMNEFGDWWASSWSSKGQPVEDDVMMESCLDGLYEGGSEARYWVMCEVELPGTRTIDAQVVRHDGA